MPIEIKACKVCGKKEAMGHSCDLCLSCRIKRDRERETKCKRRYYERHREKILEKMAAKRYRKKEDFDKYVAQKRSKPASRWTVEFIKIEGGYTWRAWFRSEFTGRLVKFEAGRNFSSLLVAKDDYKNATR